MNAEIFAEWLRRQAYHVVRTPSCYWYEAGPRVYQSVPYHWVIEPAEDELIDLLRSQRAIALRYSTPLSASLGKTSYHVICGEEYGRGCLSRQARQGVKKGLQCATIEQISLQTLADEGWQQRRDTLERQGRLRAETEQQWRRLCHSAEGLPGFEAWGAIHEGQVVASFLAFRCGDCYLLPHEQSATAFLPYRVNNALFFAVTRQALARPEIHRVFFCLQSLDAPCSVDTFKFRMGCTALPVRQRVVFHPWLARVAAKHATRAMVKRAAKSLPASYTLSKAEGMLRFFQEGQIALMEQEWPEILTDYRSRLEPATRAPINSAREALV
jgi:hypothetical protein